MTEEQLRARIEKLEQNLEHARTHANDLEALLDRKLSEIYTLYHISRTIATLLDIQEMFRQITGIIKKHIAFDRVSLYLFDDAREKLELAFFSGLNIGQSVALARGEGTPGRIVESGEHAHVHDLAVFYETFNDFLHVPGEEKRDGSYIGIALKVHNTTIGVLGVDRAVKYSLTVDDMDFMAVLSHQLAAGIEKSRLFGKIEQLSQTDGLTGLYNHRMFEERLTQEVNRRNRTGKPLSLIMIDIDHFKNFNDNYGHQAGDTVLRELARVLLDQSRSTTIDICCRYGGEEFVVITPELEMHNAVRVAERIRKAVESHPFSIKQREPSCTVTISLGVAGMGGTDDLSAEDLIKKADEALYLSKKNGRNQVSYSPEGK